MKLGQKVRGRAELIRVFSRPYEERITKRHESLKVHKRYSYLRKERDFVGYISGVRNLQKGVSAYHPEWGYLFESEGCVKVYLIAVSLKETVYALPEDVEVVEQ